MRDRDAHHGETQVMAYSGDRELRDMPSWCGLLNQTEVSSAMASIKVVPIAFLAIAASIGTGQISFAQNLGPRTEATSCAAAIGGNVTFSTISLACGIPPEVLDTLLKSRTQDLDGLASAHKDTKLDRARMQTNLGNALAMLGERESGTIKLEGALAAFRGALKEQTRERVPLDWAKTQASLGNALYTLGVRENSTAKFEEAVTAYHEALKERTRERVPLEWAQTQNNLGNALFRFEEHKSGTTKLEEAVVAYREALKERTRERVPLDWAQTQHNLGTALQVIGERQGGTMNLEQAVVAFDEALKERTRERVPLDWASSLGNQGVALMVLADRRKDVAMAKNALSQINTAFETMRRGGHAPNAAYYEHQLPRARAVVVRLRGQ